MNRTLFTTALCSLAGAMFAYAQVPSLINYQGRLTNAAGVPQPGAHTMSLKIYDAATSGTQLYTESLGSVTADANGVYAFQFGASGTSDALVTETIATTDGNALTFQKTLANTAVVANSLSVTDGTYSWNQVTGNPASTATATATVISGFVVGATVSSGGSGYTSAPAVTITGNGSGAAATATISSGSVSGITITSAGSGYTGGATITIAPPPAPFLVNYSGGAISATYSSAPVAGRTITATYRYSASGIFAAFAGSSEQWLELSVDSVSQLPRQKILAVPYAINAKTADVALALPPKFDVSQDMLPYKAYPIKQTIDLDAYFTGTTPGYGNKVSNYSITKSISNTITKIHKVATIVKNNTKTYNAGANNPYVTSYGTETLSLVAYSPDGTKTTLATQTISGQSGTLTLQGPFVLDNQNFQYELEFTAGVYSSSSSYAITGVYYEVGKMTMTYDSM